MQQSHSELETWTAAKNLDELKSLFAQKEPPPFITASMTPPPIGQTMAAPPTKKKGGRRFIWTALLLLLIISGVTFGVISFINRNRSGAGTTSNYFENKLSLADYERAHPDEFLTASGTYNETILGNKMRIQGTVTNKATVANFKDIIIEVKYYSGTKTLISTERFVLYEFVPAHSKKSFEWKIKPPGGTETMGWDAVGGVPYP
jgi:hypothetical protein